MKKMQTVTDAQFQKKRFLTWLGNDPHKEAALVQKGIAKIGTIQRIKSGTYTPSIRMSLAIDAFIEENKNKVDWSR